MTVREARAIADEFRKKGLGDISALPPEQQKWLNTVAEAFMKIEGWYGYIHGELQKHLEKYGG